MTKRGLSVGDNGGRCESCNELGSEYRMQTGYPVLLGGGIGWGKMWLCPKCLVKHQARDATKKCQIAAAQAQIDCDAAFFPKVAGKVVDLKFPNEPLTIIVVYEDGRELKYVGKPAVDIKSGR